MLFFTLTLTNGFFTTTTTTTTTTLSSSVRHLASSTFTSAVSVSVVRRSSGTNTDGGNHDEL